MTDLFHPDATDAAVQRPPSARAERRRKRKRAAQRRRNIITFVVMMFSLAFVVTGGWLLLRPLFNPPDTVDANTSSDYPGPGSGSVEVVIHSGDTGAAIGQTLVEADVVASVDAFVAALALNPDSSSIQPGTYTLSMQIPAQQAVAALLDPANRGGGLTIPEGWRADQIYAAVSDALGVPVADVEAAAADLVLPDQAEGAVEGWLFPSTYTPAQDATPVQVLQQMVDQTVAVLEANSIPQDQWHDVIVTASIIEKEVASDEYRALVAEVIHNRIVNTCNGSGRLEMDSTLVYELGKPASEITVSEFAADTPYNTRIIVGLPPTAIGSPGEASIIAAANPSTGTACYFVTVNLDTGETKFTDNYDTFLEYKNEYETWRESQTG